MRYWETTPTNHVLDFVQPKDYPAEALPKQVAKSCCQCRLRTKVQRHAYTSTMDMVLQLIGSFSPDRANMDTCLSKAWAKCDVNKGCPECKQKFKQVPTTWICSGKSIISGKGVLGGKTLKKIGLTSRSRG
jgi:hypothetical protein